MASITIRLPDTLVNGALDLRERLRAFATKRASNSSSDDYARIVAAIGRENGYRQEDLTRVASQLKQFSTSWLIYVAVREISRTAALVELSVVIRNGEKLKQVENHPIEQLLRKPNSRMSGFNLLEATVGFLQLTGNAYWYLASTNGGQPDQIYILRPDRVRIKPGLTEDRPVDAYVYELSSVSIPIDPDAIIHFKRWHPSNDYYGLSPIESVMLDLQSDMQMARFNLNTFARDKAVPAGILTLKNPISDAEYERVQREWRETYGGVNQATAIIRGADTAWQGMGMTHEDLDFLNGRQFTKELVMLVFGIPPGMLDKNATEANARAGMEIFTANTIYPQMIEISSTLTLTLCPFYADNIEMQCPDIRITDRKADLQEELANAPYISIDEKRANDGLKPMTPVLVSLPSGEQVNIGDLPAPMALALVSAQAAGGSATPEPTPTEATHDISPSAAAKGLEVHIPFSPVERIRQWKEVAERVERDTHIEIADIEWRQAPITTASRKEIARFGRFAAKRLFPVSTDSVKGYVDVGRFVFNDTPYPIELTARMAVEIAADDHDFTLMLDALCNPIDPFSFKAIMPAEDRVSVSGKVDPHAKLKTKYAKQISSDTQDYFDGLANRVKSAIRHEVSASKASPLPSDLKKRVAGNLDAQFWRDEAKRLTGVLQPIIHDLSEDASNDEADLISMKYGVTVDPASIISYASTLAAAWGNEWPEKITQTTQDGVNAIVSRYANDNTGTVDDLTSAIDSSYLFSPTRADNIGETETSRTTGNAQHRTAVEAAEMMGVDMMFSQADFYTVYPAHINCRCHVATEFIYDDSGKIIGVNMRWYTVKDLGAVPVCPICQPLDGMLVSEIANY